MNRFRFEKWSPLAAATVLAAGLVAVPARADEPKKDHQHAGMAIPHSLKAEHEELHAQLVRATREKGAVGEAAKAVAELLHPHFEKEEAFAMPVLGLLPKLAEGKKIAPEVRAEAVKLTEKLRAEMPAMLREHGQIVEALKRLEKAAKDARKPEYAHFAEKLIQHARTEEEVLYPAALVVGEYLKLKMRD